MSEYPIVQLYPGDRQLAARIDELLTHEGIRKDRNLDYTCAILDEQDCPIATGSCYGPTLRCFAVSAGHRGEGLLNEVISHLIAVQYERGYTHLFLHTKPDSAKFFGSVGFYEIGRVEEKLVFMENRRDGFSGYLDALARTKKGGVSAAVVMNANPFTLGHQHLVETAAACCDTLHLFVVSEDASLVPFAVRRQLVEAGTAHLSSVVLHDCGPYLISNATFPSYFLKGEASIIETQARLDVSIFERIARRMGISCRFVGEEPLSQVTSLYNRIMAQELPKAGIACRVIPRKAWGGQPISASTARKALKDGDWDAFRALVPKSTFDWFAGSEAKPVLERIRSAASVIHD